jgi:UDP-glucose 4-epimerase
VAKFIKQALAGERLEIYGDGNQTRDYIHISDLVAAIRAAASVAGIGGETFQIATASETSLLEIVDALIAAMRAEGLEPPETYHGEKRVGDVERNFSDTSKARKILGWIPKMGLEDGLRRTIRYFQDLEEQSKAGD